MSEGIIIFPDADDRSRQSLEFPPDNFVYHFPRLPAIYAPSI